MKNIDIQSYKALNIPKLNDNIQITSELGKKFLRDYSPLKAGEDEKAKFEFEKVSVFMELLKTEKGVYDNLNLSLKHLEDISVSILKSKKNTLELFEIQEIKSFVYFYNKIRDLVYSCISQYISLENLDELFSYLDKDKQNSPAFRIGNSYSEKLHSLRISLADLSREKKHLFSFQLNKAKKILNSQKIEATIMISRYDKDNLTKIENSRFFYRESENFTNITFKLKKTEKIIEIEKKINILLENIKLEEEICRKNISKFIGNFSDKLIQSEKIVGELDFILAKAYFANKYDCTIPEISIDNEIIIKKAINLPILEEMLNSNIEYQPINLYFNKHLNIITGANMAGKTSALKTIGQLHYLTSFAIPLPAKSAKIPLVDFIFFSSAFSNSRRMDLSSFGMEIVAINNILNKKGCGLYLIDEFARGTNPEEGEVFSQAILSNLGEKKGFTFSATHFSAPLKIESAGHYRIAGISDSIHQSLYLFKDKTLEERLRILHRFMNYDLERVENKDKPPHAALIIAEILGIDRNIIEQAKMYLES